MDDQMSICAVAGEVDFFLDLQRLGNDHNGVSINGGDLILICIDTSALFV